jgi:hypothetical protein
MTIRDVWLMMVNYRQAVSAGGFNIQSIQVFLGMPRTAKKGWKVQPYRRCRRKNTLTAERRRKKPEAVSGLTLLPSHLTRISHHSRADILVCREIASVLADKNVCPTVHAVDGFPRVVRNAG